MFVGFLQVCTISLSCSRTVSRLEQTIVFNSMEKVFRTHVFLIGYDLRSTVAHVVGWEPSDLRYLGHVSWGESVFYRLRTALVAAG